MAFEAAWDEIESNSCHLISCCCLGVSATRCCDPCMMQKHKFCCCAGGISSGEDCVGEKGCLVGIHKTFCCVQTASCNNLACGCCDIFILGRPYGEGRVMDQESNFMQDARWCYYCLFTGCALAPASPEPSNVSHALSICGVGSAGVTSSSSARRRRAPQRTATPARAAATGTARPCAACTGANFQAHGGSASASVAAPCAMKHLPAVLLWQPRVRHACEASPFAAGIAFGWTAGVSPASRQGAVPSTNIIRAHAS
ncbi:unnamed protein product [Effrenium voratum]|uniref:Uncharacterized protein n=1 Tax=Effrenium voratum TaxID=2562239 RepID=A0AA36JAU0_9DINO|nr:unnamed protein product [Effrenium voratum]CAJ1427101.1 unnamed protein product [Effrenium voratum]